MIVNLLIDDTGGAISLQVFVVSHPLGFLVVDKKKKVLFRLIFPLDPKQAAKLHLSIRKGEWIEELQDLIDYLDGNPSIDGVVVDSRGIKNLIASKTSKRVIVDPTNPILFYYRERPLEVAKALNWNVKEPEYCFFLVELGIELSRGLIRSELTKRDKLIIRSIDYLDHLNKALNILIPAIREWHSIHFPELDQLVDDHYIYTKIVSSFPDRRTLNFEELRNLGVKERLARDILTQSRESMGGELDAEDYSILGRIAGLWVDLYDNKEQVEEYLERLVRECAPNLSAIIQPLIVARLIAMAGSLERLAMMPSSTIQVLGARKAIFLHMTRGTKPPKHGILFQVKEIRNAPKKIRGKIARIIATKAALAARIDAFGGEFIGDKLKKEIEEEIKKVKGVKD